MDNSNVLEYLLSIKEYKHSQNNSQYGTLPVITGITDSLDWYIDEEENLALVIPKNQYALQRTVKQN